MNSIYHLQTVEVCQIADSCKLYIRQVKMARTSTRRNADNMALIFMAPKVQVSGAWRQRSMKVQTMKGRAVMDTPEVTLDLLIDAYIAQWGCSRLVALTRIIGDATERRSAIDRSLSACPGNTQ
jgi:hypothetical protein